MYPQRHLPERSDRRYKMVEPTIHRLARCVGCRRFSLASYPIL